jgi:hypothetical protein
MKKLLVLLLIAAFLVSSAPAFAAQGNPPGDGGYFTKFFNGLLGDSWAKGPTAGTPPTGTKEEGQAQRKKISKCMW